jgi:ribose 5-phosphate isomerase B
MRIAIASDHAGFPLKSELVPWLTQLGHDVTDLGTESVQTVDYPWYCARAAQAVVAGRADAGIVLGGSGQGEAIAANKVRGARAALCLDEYTARLARAHNDANVLSLGARILAPEFARAIVEVFLSTSFEGGRHVPRLQQLTDIEDAEAATPHKT